MMAGAGGIGGSMTGGGAGGNAGVAGGGKGGMAGGGMAGGGNVAGNGGMAGVGGAGNGGVPSGGMAGAGNVGGNGGMAGAGNVGGNGGMAGAGNTGGNGGAGGNGGRAGDGGGGFTSGGAGGRWGDGGRAGDGGSSGTSGSSCHVVINEVSTAGPNGAADEYVEIFNPCTRPIDLIGVRLLYRAAAGTADTVLFNFQTSTVMPAGNYLLFAGEDYMGMSDGVFAATQGRLAAAGGGIALRDADMIDAVGYGTATNAYVETSAAPAPPSAQSIARTPNGVDTNNNLADLAVAARSPRAANP
jgi:hypothetical protein